MEQYIPKSAVVAEIERRIKIFQSNPYENHKTICHLDSLKQSYNALEVKEIGVDFGDPKGDKSAKYIIDTKSFEVKEVDLEKEIQDHIKECLDVKFPTTDIELIKKDVAYTARRFFELGVNASNPFTWEDINEILYAERLVLREFGTQELSNEELCSEVLKRLKRTERIMVMEQPVMLQSNCESCQLYEGFGQCFEHGNNLVENCKDYKKG